MARPRVLFVLRDYPQLSQTYIKREIEAVQDACEVRVVALNPPDLPFESPVPYTHEKDPGRILEQIQEFRPRLLHTHYLTMVELVSGLARKAGLPFTVRAHSTDCLRSPEGIRFIREGRRGGGASRLAGGGPSVATRLRRWYRRLAGERPGLGGIAPLVNDDRCLGLLSFPFTRPLLEGAGYAGAKIHDAFPIVDVGRFHDRGPNGTAIMGVGAYITKKRTEDFLQLARDVPETAWNLYAIGYHIERLHERARSMGSPARIVPPLPPEAMPPEYKKHRWLVYTACPERASIGWPMAVAEAQAAGVGVCLANVRPDLREYVGDAGILYDSLADVARRVRQPFPDEMREQGFALARRTDVSHHRAQLLALWRRALAESPGPGAPA